VQIGEVIESTPVLVGGVTAGATLLAVVVTSLFNIRVTRLNIDAQAQQKAKALRIAKLEELYFLFDKWQLNLSGIYLHHLRCYRGKLTCRQVMDLVNAPGLLAPGEAQKYRMVMELHFPSLATDYAQVEATRRRVVPFLSDPAVSKLGATEFVACQVAFESACEAFKSKISALAHEALAS